MNDAQQTSPGPQSWTYTMTVGKGNEWAGETPGPCLLCGADPAQGWAKVNEDGHQGWLCHGDETPPDVFTCFEEWTVNNARP